jgi:hypothetical protein
VSTIPFLSAENPSSSPKVNRLGALTALAVALTCLLLSPLSSTAQAQETTGVPGSPSATTTIEGNQLPPPPQKFEGKIERNAAQSTPYWPARVVPPRGAPNILLIMTDDTGFGVSSTFGGVIPTPNLDRIQRTDSATPTSTRRRYAHRHARPSSPVAIITRWALGWLPSSQQASPATTAS